VSEKEENELGILLAAAVPVFLCWPQQLNLGQVKANLKPGASFSFEAAANPEWTHCKEVSRDGAAQLSKVGHGQVKDRRERDSKKALFSATDQRNYADIS
jgi:hypothetical protein